MFRLVSLPLVSNLPDVELYKSVIFLPSTDALGQDFPMNVVMKVPIVAKSEQYLSCFGRDFTSSMPPS
jgi:hypothetical protein